VLSAVKFAMFSRRRQVDEAEEQGAFANNSLQLNKSEGNRNCLDSILKE